MKTVFKIVVGGAAAMFLLICVVAVIGIASVGNAVNHDQHTSDRVSQVWSQIYVGESKAEVRDVLGEPDDKSTFTTTNYEGGTDRMDDWMYGTLGETTYTVSFVNGVVDSKSSL